VAGRLEQVSTGLLMHTADPAFFAGFPIDRARFPCLFAGPSWSRRPAYRHISYLQGRQIRYVIQGPSLEHDGGAERNMATMQNTRNLKSGRKPARHAPAGAKLSSRAKHAIDFTRYIPTVLSSLVARLRTNANAFFSESYGVSLTEWRILSFLQEAARIKPAGAAACLLYPAPNPASFSRSASQFENDWSGRPPI
jgi:hypothetical protein